MSSSQDTDCDVIIVGYGPVGAFSALLLADAGLRASDIDGLATAGAIGCPALLVLGARDAMTPARAAKPLAEAIPGARTTVLDGCGHMMMSEQPDQVLDALITIL